MPFDFSFARAEPRPADDATGGGPLSLELRDVAVVRAGRRLIDSLTLAATPGLRTAVMGPNGAGKSLTLRLLQGALSPDEGAVLVGGRQAEPGPRRDIGLVLQRPVLLRRSVRANLDHALRAHALRIHGLPRAERPARIAELLRLAGLETMAESPARSLSGGEQQRLSIVRALAAEPAVLLLDEPTASLDPNATQAVEKLIDRTAASGVKIVLVTHDLGQARRLADEVLFLHRGRLVEQAPASQFFTAPASDPARAYLEGRLVL